MHFARNFTITLIMFYPSPSWMQEGYSRYMMCILVLYVNLPIVVRMQIPGKLLKTQNLSFKIKPVHKTVVYMYEQNKPVTC